MVRVWLADVTPLCDEACYRKYYEELPLFRKKKADALRSCQGRAQSAGAWSLWGKIRAEYGLPESSAYNLSHSGSFVMCAAETDAIPCRVGCDLQQMGTLRMKIAERFFCREEYLTVLEGRTERTFLQILGAQGKLSESDQERDGSADGFFFHPAGGASGPCKAAGRISGTVSLQGVLHRRTAVQDGGLHDR